MGIFDKVGKLFGGASIDENAVLAELNGLGLNPKSLSVVAHAEGKLAVIGRVSSEQDKTKLLETARNCKGVNSIDDRLKVEVEATEPPPVIEPDHAPEPAPADNAEDATPNAAGTEDSPASTDQHSSDASADTTTVHTVQPGDTLSAIAKQYYGDASQYMIIFEANQPPLDDPNTIFPGQELKIPSMN
ncbi:MAG: LysM peptidoglycan-binding domain-containing protein [Pseudomonadota bacterium]